MTLMSLEGSRWEETREGVRRSRNEGRKIGQVHGRQVGGLYTVSQ